MVSDPFSLPAAYLIRPDGGIDIKKMYDAGIRVFMLCMQDTDTKDDGFITVDGKQYPTWSFTAWDHRGIPAEVDKYPDAIWIPWAFITHDSECWKLRSLAHAAYERQRAKMWRPAGCWNIEKALETSISLMELIPSALGCDVLLSTTPWAFTSVVYSSMPAHWVIDVQLFPAFNNTSKDPRSCRSRFYKFGFRGRVHFMHGRTGAMPSALPFPEYGRTTIYPGDDLQHPELWCPWRLGPVPSAVFPYLGPWYPPGHPKCIYKKEPQIIIIKNALHNAGYGDFVSPDAMFNRSLTQALRAMQHDHGLQATGYYGKGSWEVLRRLASAVPGHTHALALAP